MTDPPTGNVEARAEGDSRQFNLGQGTMNVHLAAERPTTALFTVIPPPDLVGRDQEINTLLSGVRVARGAGCPLVVTALQGMAGVGKTALARAVAARLSGEFPDARLEVDLYGFTPGEEPRDPADVLAELLSLAGFQAADLPVSLPGKSQLWRSWLAGRDVLLVLDNARDAAQVRPLLPGAASRCLVLITSRNELDDLDGATRVRLDTLPVADALTLLDRLSGQTASADDELRGELARLCGHLPLALRPVGALLAEVSDVEVIEAMRSAARPLLHIPAGERAVAAAFNVSYLAASTAEQAMLRACAWHPGPDFDACSLAALTECAPAVAALTLAGLAKRSMLLRLPGRRYAFHDLFLGYTRERVSHDDSDVTVADGRERLCAYVFTTAELATDALLGRADRHGDSHRGLALGSTTQARDWLTAATAELRTVAHFALASNSPSAVRLSQVVAWWLLMDNRPDQAYALRIEIADHCHRGGDRLGRAHAVIGLGDVARMRGEYGEAAEAYRQARALYEQIGNRLGQANVSLSEARMAESRGDSELACIVFAEAGRIYGTIGLVHWENHCDQERSRLDCS